MKNLFAVFILSGLVLSAAQLPAMAQGTPYYRVEVIVLTHSAGQSDERPVQTLDDYSRLIDPMRQARIAQIVEAQEDDTDPTDESDVQRTVDALTALELMPEDMQPALALPPPQPDTFVNLEDLSPTMRDAWRRLQNSGEFQPRSWRAWHQPLARNRVSPPVRVHDQQIVRLDWLAVTPLGSLQPANPDRDLAVADLAPRSDYRLDGSVRLRQRQFMHVELDLVWREPVEREPAFGPMRLDESPAGSIYQHRLKQSRAVRPGRLEYFDSNWLGVLVLIERWEAPAEGATSQPGTQAN
ncbi:MAG: CsiV family protein [Wenzhouxiangella sp.]